MPNCSNALLNHLVAEIVDHSVDDLVDDLVDDIIYFIGDNIVDESVITNMLNGPI
jgi:DNA gyrase/topoisomerase IV subunit B